MEVSFTGNKFKKENAICLKGDYYDIGIKVTKWNDEGGLNAYDTSRVVHYEDDRKTGKRIKRVVKGKRYNKRKGGVAAINKIVQHHTGGYTPQQAFETLHNSRGISTTFLTGDVGEVYQTLDMVEKAWQAGDINNSSIGIENALYPDASNTEAYSAKRRKRLGLAPHKTGKITIQGCEREVYLLTKKQVDSLVVLTAGIWAALDYQNILQDKRVPPYFMVDNDGGPLTSFSKDYKNHKGMLLHANSKISKWDLAGIEDLESFESRVSEQYYQFVKKF